MLNIFVNIISEKNAFICMYCTYLTWISASIQGKNNIQVYFYHFYQDTVKIVEKHSRLNQAGLTEAKMWLEKCACHDDSNRLLEKRDQGCYNHHLYTDFLTMWMFLQPSPAPCPDHCMQFSPLIAHREGCQKNVYSF